MPRLLSLSVLCLCTWFYPCCITAWNAVAISSSTSSSSSWLKTRSSSSSSSTSLHAVQVYVDGDGILRSGKLDIDFNPEQPKETLSTFERVGRAAQFYSKAAPVFISYLLLDARLRASGEYETEEVSRKVEAEWEKLHEWGSDEISQAITELKGFYPKTGQIIATRVDIFPHQYTSKLSNTLDDLDPLPAKEIIDVIRRDLLDGAEMSEMFAEFDLEPLGSASIAQVHKAKLLDGRVVAVKVQRPGIRGKLLGDIANLKNFARVVDRYLPLDYYKVFCEIEKNLGQELDFMIEAQMTMKVASAVSHSPSNRPIKKAPVLVPLPIPGLVSKRAMVLEFIEGQPLSKLAKEMESKGFKAGSPESLVLGRRLLQALTDAYSNMIFGSGIIHGDPHPGNIFVMDQGEIALLDCGQVKMMKNDVRNSLAGLIVLVHKWEKAKLIDENGAEAKEYIRQLAKKVKSFGVTFAEDAGDDCAAAVAILLFGSTDTALPGGYAGEELSIESPIAQVIEFPQEFVLLGRATVMIKGIANRLGITWSLSDRWAAAAEEAIASNGPKESLPIWSVVDPRIYSKSGRRRLSVVDRVRFNEVKSGLGYAAELMNAYIVKKSELLIKSIIPQSILERLIRLFLKLNAFITKPANS